VWAVSVWSGNFFEQIEKFARSVLLDAFHTRIDRNTLVRLYADVLMHILLPFLMLGACLMLVTFAAQMGTTQLGFSFQKVAPEFGRLNPLEKIKQFPQQGISSLKQAILLLPLFGYAAYRIAEDNLSAYLSLPGLSIQPALRIIGGSYQSLLWKAGAILFLLGIIDFIRQRNKHAKSLRMTKQEVKEETKETEGNPQIKQRIRRLQRDAARRSMMKEVPKATAVIVNPTHYSVAIRYEMQSMAAPRVVAKGKNYLARRIREIANDHQIPIVENQPLAQALYKSADVGQEIPPHLYRAVAEILAYLFKLMNQGA
jgi:flagellar biosynthetic protein FlhB